MHIETETRRFELAFGSILIRENQDIVYIYIYFKKGHNPRHLHRTWIDN